MNKPYAFNQIDINAKISEFDKNDVNHLALYLYILGKGVLLITKNAFCAFKNIKS